MKSILSLIAYRSYLYPNIFFSKKMLPAEFNYEVYNRKLLAIIKYFKEKRLDLEFSLLSLKVYIFYRGLRQFESKK